MPKETSKDIFHLIKCLTKSEKRYFKVNYSQGKEGGESFYVKLFDAIDRQREYDEKKILATEDYITHLPTLKGRLYEVILKSLAEFHAGSSTDVVIYRDLHKVEILFNKALHEQALKLLGRVKIIAESKEDFVSLFRVLDWERRIYIASSYSSALEKKNSELYIKEQEYIKKFSNLSEYKQLWDNITRALKVQGLHSRSEEEQRNITQIIESPLLASEQNALSNKAKGLHFNIIASYEFSRMNYRNALLNFEKRIEVIEHSPGSILDHPLVYISALYNILVCYQGLYDAKGFYTIVNKLRDLPSKYPSFKNSTNIQMRIFWQSYMRELEMNITSGNYERALSLINIIDEGLKQYGDMIPGDKISVFYYCFALLQFIADNKRKSLYWLNRIFSMGNKAEVIVKALSHILLLIIQYERGDADSLEYTIKSTYRYLYKSRRIYKLETILLHYLRKETPNLNNPKEIIDSFIRLKVEIEEIVKDPFELNALANFDFISWLESKIENKKFADVAKVKILQKMNSVKAVH